MTTNPTPDRNASAKKYAQELAKTAERGPAQDAGALAISQEPAPFAIVTTDAAAAMELFRGMKVAPRFVTIEEGQAIRVELLDQGATMVRDRQTDIEKDVPTWIVRGPDGARYEFLSAHELNRVLRPLLVGIRERGERWNVGIWRGRDKKSNGRNVTDYVITTEKIGAGQ